MKNYLLWGLLTFVLFESIQALLNDSFNHPNFILNISISFIVFVLGGLLYGYLKEGRNKKEV